MSSHLRSLERRNIVFAILAIALGAVMFLRADATTSVKKDTLPKVFPGFDSETIQRITLVRPAVPGERAKEDVVLERGAQGWYLADKFRYPLLAPPNSLLDAVASARLRSEVTRRVATFGKYAGAGGWVEATFTDKGGRDVAAFAIGNYIYPESFLRLGSGEEQRVVKAVNITPREMPTDTASWIETRMWPGLSDRNMIRIDVEQRPDDRTITILRRGESPADVGMECPAAFEPEGEKDEDAKKDDEKKGPPERTPDDKIYWVASPVAGDGKKIAVEDLVREFTGMLIEAPVSDTPTAEQEQEFGLDKPELVARLWHKEQDRVTQHAITVGKKVPGRDAWYVKRDGAAWVFTVAASSIARMRQDPQEFLAPPPEEKKDDEKKDGDAVGDPDGPPPVEPKQDDPKKDEPKKDPPKKDPPKKDPPKKDPPKKDEPKKDG